MKFRQREMGTVWHWCRNCKHWPEKDYKEMEGGPELMSNEYECRVCRYLVGINRCRQLSTPVKH